MRWRLRYLQHDLELSEGQFAVGRNATCQLSLDDPLVSRRHALLVVTDEGVTIEDLQSRNGVLVNGKRITERVPVEVGDRILSGAQERTLLQGRAVTSRDHQNTTGHQAKMTLPKMEASLRLPSDLPGPGPSSAPPDGSQSDIDPSMVRRADAFKLLGGVAEKALALGRAVEAERLLASPLADVIELYAAQGRPCPALVIDELYIAMRKVATVDVNRLREYLASLRSRLATFGPADRFLFQRLEGLERLAALR